MVGRLVRYAALASILIIGSVLSGRPVLADENEAVLKCTTDQVMPTVGSQVNVACSLIDNVGVPLTDTEVTFYVRTENKSDANWANGRKVAIIKTDARGQVKGILDAGPKVGNLILQVNYPGIFSYTTFLIVADSATPASSTTTAPTTTATASASTTTTGATTGQSTSGSTSTSMPQTTDGSVDEPE